MSWVGWTILAIVSLGSKRCLRRVCFGQWLSLSEWQEACCLCSSLVLREELSRKPMPVRARDRHFRLRSGRFRSSVIPAGQKHNLSIELVLTNLSDHPIDAPSAWFIDSAFDATYRFDIRDSTGKQIPWVPPPTVAFIGNPKSDTLEPGKSKSETVEIAEFFDLSKPGSYVVQAMRRAAFKNPAPRCGPADLDEKGDVIVCDPGRAMPVTADLTKGDILSNKITITVVPANDITGPSLSR